MMESVFNVLWKLNKKSHTSTLDHEKRHSKGARVYYD